MALGISDDNLDWYAFTPAGAEIVAFYLAGRARERLLDFGARLDFARTSTRRKAGTLGHVYWSILCALLFKPGGSNLASADCGLRFDSLVCRSLVGTQMAASSRFCCVPAIGLRFASDCCVRP